MTEEKRRVIVDQTHCGRHVTGIERITLELFSAEALAPFDARILRSPDRKRMIFDQMISLPVASWRDPRALVLCSGFPPTPGLALRGDRVVTYIHDLFLLTRPQDLNWRAKFYMAPSLRFALKRLRRFLVNSETTGAELLKFARRDAEIRLYRPEVRNVLGLPFVDRSQRDNKSGPRFVALGTVEPRKNLAAAARIVAALRAKGFPDATLDIVGRDGWGDESARLKQLEGVTLHGYLPIERIREIMSAADLFISTSHAEGLGLPLLEAQYSGIPVIAPDQPVFREALAESGSFIFPEDTEKSADMIASVMRREGWRVASATASLANIARWNETARADHAAVIAWLEELSASLK
ncbi:glycosyltransferase [Terrarubrum flagellatum]|uniref:glycosyltransferase n=1 Tax=Terrirubrum flagellatum TaxID=2895980 RepID=UPI0031455772